VWHAPVFEKTREPAVGRIVDHQHGCPAEMELFHDAQPHTLKAAHDYVIAHLQADRWLHVNRMSSQVQPEIARSLIVRDIPPAQASEPPGLSLLTR
jgi:hypothetical protein